MEMNRPVNSSRKSLLSRIGVVSMAICPMRMALRPCRGTGRLRGNDVRRGAMHQPPISHVAASDTQIAELIEGEAARQFSKLRMIPSENYVSMAVLEASGSVLTNKYSEGYAGRRYY